MAGISHGRPVATTTGHLTEPLWAESGAVALAPAGDADALATIAEGLLAEPSRLVSLGLAARALYEERFDVEKIVDRLLEDPPAINGVGLAASGRSRPS
jgi:glycosyltransferase involved in cell wall biosynthesis